MEHHYRKAKRTDCITCSSLRRVDPYATGNMRMDVVLEVILAVPSDGSNPMQLNKLVNFEVYQWILQYPQTGRTLCNLLGLPQYHLASRLAVPSDGSNPMQRNKLRRCAANNKPCNTLRRVQPYATHT